MRKICLVLVGLLLLAACEKRNSKSESDNSKLGNTPVPVPLPEPMDWSQPPVGCAEEMIPNVAPKPCPDYTNVVDIFREWPQGYSAEEIDYWKSRKRGIDYCRAVEVLKREKEKPGSYSAGTVETAWMREQAVHTSALKTSLVYQASRKFEIPTQILVGALQQESLFSDLFISDDGGNFSCGIGQINLFEWCAYANMLDPQQKREIGWPLSRVDCGKAQPVLIKPFYDIGKVALGTQPEYLLNLDMLKDITIEQVKTSWTDVDEPTQQLRFQLATSFINHCQDPTLNIFSKAKALRSIYVGVVPDGFKQNDVYTEGAKFKRQCQETGFEKAYPLHRGWLMAVGVYNAGPKAIDSFAYYNSLTADDLASATKMNKYTPKDFVEALYWSGSYNPLTDKIHFQDLKGRETSWVWFKPCVLQRHIARVVQHVTLPKIDPLADTLEGTYGCAKSVFDPQTGQLIKSGVPPMRQTSTGRRPN